MDTTVPAMCKLFQSLRFHCRSLAELTRILIHSEQGEAVEKSSLYFAVKTCSKFHYDRVPVVQQTWAPHTQRLVYYSDVFGK